MPMTPRRDSPTTAVTLRALEGKPLADESVRSMVQATAHAIAERQGVKVLALRAEADHITVSLNVGQIEAIGFAAELRRLTNNWYAHKSGQPTLWGEPTEEGEEWKRA
jgi:lysozyme family protein